MATGTPIPVEEYLRTSWRPDRDYVEGELLERQLGERVHGGAQRELMFRLASRYPQLRKRLFPAQRVQISGSRFRVPDVCVLAENAPDEQIVRTPPLLCVEVLSKDDTLESLWDRIEDYFAIGVPVCWIVDPIGRPGWIATPNHLDKVTDGILRADDIEMPLAEVFE